MNCKEMKTRYANEFETMVFEYCPCCGVHAPWINDCKEEEE